MRLFWIEGMPGVGDFTANDAMPAVLPTFAGRLALDFVPGASPSGPLSFVFFDGTTVTAVPASTGALSRPAGPHAQRKSRLRPGRSCSSAE